MILSVVVYKAEISGGVIPFTMGLLACVAVILMVAGVERRFGRGMDFLAKYTMPIFLMHTMFAASTRAVSTSLRRRISSTIVRWLQRTSRIWSMNCSVATARKSGSVHILITA